MRVHHIAFRTRDLDRLADFYCDVLGFPLLRQSFSGFWLDAESSILMIEPADEDEPEIPAGSMDAILFSMTPETRAECTDRLMAAGVAIERETNYSIYFRDPDGRRVGLSHYPDPRIDPGPSA